MSDDALFNSDVRQAIIALRRGEEGRIGLSMKGTVDFLSSNINMVNNPERSSQGFMLLLGVVNRMLDAQQRGDWIRLADMLEYELSEQQITRLFAVTSLSISHNDCVNSDGKRSIEVRLVVKRREDDDRSLEHQFRLQYLGVEADSGYEEEACVRDYSEEPVWTWSPDGPPGLYRLTVWSRYRMPGYTADFDFVEHLDYEL